MYSEKNLRYDPTDEESILAYASELEGQTLNEAIPSYERTIDGGRGIFGLVLEIGYFGLERNNESRPDFAEVGIELKSSSLKRIRTGELRAKERISLSMIDYGSLADENGSLFTTSFWTKISRMLLVFYEYSPHLNTEEYPIRIARLWEFPEEDKLVLAKDWELIKSYVDKGHAHLLSEGLTNYLGAATKGASSRDLTKQPNSPELAMRRAFSLKTSYVNQIVNRLLNNFEYNLFSSLKREELRSNSIEQAFIQRIDKFKGKSVHEICEYFREENFNMSSYSVYSKITRFMLCSSNNIPLELIKAEINVKSIRLQPNGVPKEAVSFPSFKYAGIINESWNESTLFELLDSKKFLFSIFEITDDDIIFKGIKFWSMPHADIQICKQVWEDTKNKIRKGQIVKKVTSSRRYTNFIKSSARMKIHIRPHARNAEDTYPLPIRDELTGLKDYTKHSFWLNQSYLTEIISQEEK